MFFKKISKYLIMYSFFILIIPLLMLFLNLFNIDISRTIILIISSISFIIMGIIYGIHIKKNAFLNGIITSSIFIFILFIISLLCNFKISLFSLIYYLILITIFTLSSIIGINIKAKNN